MPHTVTRKTLRQNIIKRLYRGRFPITSTTTSTAGDTSEFIDTTLEDGDIFDGHLSDAYILVVETVVSGPVYGEARKVTGLSSGNQWQVETAFSAAVQTGTDYELHYRFHPFVIDDKIDRILEELRVPTLMPLSILRNTDFSKDDGTAGTPDYWSNNNVTLTIESQEDDDDEDFMFLGSYNNKLLATGASPTISTVFPTSPTQSYVITVPVLSTDGDKITITHESPAGTVITTGSTSWGFSADSYRHSVIHFTTTTATSQYIDTIKIALENTDTFCYIPFVLITPIGHTMFDLLPHREIDGRDSVVVSFPLGEKIEATDSANNFLWMTKEATKYCNVSSRFQDYHGGLSRVTLDRPSDGTPMFLVGDEPFTPIGASATYATRDAFKTQAPAKLVEYLVVQELLEEWAEQEDILGHEVTAQRLFSRAQQVKQQYVAPESRRVFGRAQAFITGTI